MKRMDDRDIDMDDGKPESEGFFPEEPKRKELRSPREIRNIRYPDTEEEIYDDQEQAIRASDAGRQDAGYRH